MDGLIRKNNKVDNTGTYIADLAELLRNAEIYIKEYFETKNI